jgi:hypothetical protein
MLLARRPRRAEPVLVAVSADGDASLAHGVVIGAHLVARLGRVPLLRVEGTVVLSPGQVSSVRQIHIQDHGYGEVAASNAADGLIGADLAGVARALHRLRRL